MTPKEIKAAVKTPLKGKTATGSKKPSTYAVPSVPSRGKLIGKSAGTPAAAKARKPASTTEIASWPFPVPLKGEAKEIQQTAVSVASASANTGHRRLRHGDWTLNINASPPEGWYYCLCRNEEEGTIGFLVMHYDPFRGHFRRPIGEDAPEGLEVIAYTPVPCGAFVNNMLDDFDYYLEHAK